MVFISVYIEFYTSLSLHNVEHEHLVGKGKLIRNKSTTIL